MNKVSYHVTCVLLFISSAFCIIDPEIYKEIKQKAPFEVLEYEKIIEIFKGVNRSDPAESLRKSKELEQILTAKLRESEQKQQNESSNFLVFMQQTKFPKEFDWRKVKPECFSPPKHQMRCGSCYIFAPISAFESRLCIKSSGKIKIEASQQDVLSCATDHNKCGGGLITTTWEFLENSGTCDYRCKPYVSFDGSVPTCTSKCDDNKSSYNKWKAKKGSLIMFGPDYDKMKEEIITNGPINAFMDTFEDMSAYKGGLYFHTTGKQTDPHAITIVGWSYDDTYKSDYWIIRNSWGPEWGEGGYFKVLKGYYKIGEFNAVSMPEI
jgi:C1A family cysteine protease